METKIISETIPINPYYLDNNIKTHMLNLLKQDIQGTCTLSNGYIISVNKIIELGDNIISSANSFIIFNIKYEITYIKPEIQKVYYGKVCMILENGIFVYIENMLKILIPSTTLKYVKYKIDTNTFSNEDITINIGYDIYVEITAIKYETNMFRCIGKMVENQL